jgi:dTDP-4-dehydrorhamnose 3,5-epimerase
VNFEPLSVAGAYLVSPQTNSDERGSFARVYCRDEFITHGLDPAVTQCSISRNTTRATLRGMHYQCEPHAEVKLVRCQRGAAFHAIVDLREASDSYCQWSSVELSADNSLLLYVPQGVAHGFLTLEPDTEIYYQMSTAYCEESARGVRWNDPAFDIRWPADVAVISERDSRYPDFTPGH